MQIRNAKTWELDPSASCAACMQRAWQLYSHHACCSDMILQDRLRRPIQSEWPGFARCTVDSGTACSMHARLHRRILIVGSGTGTTRK